jgi:hypothetical protein
MRTLVRSVAALALVVLVAAGSGCGIGRDSPAPASTAMSDADILAIGKRIGQCLRDNGIPDFPDPIVDSGRIKLPDGVEERIEAQYSQTVLEQAMAACQSLFDELPESAMRGEDEQGGDADRVPRPEDIEALRKFAQCIRDSGEPNWPDPKPDGTFPVIGTPLHGEAKSPRMVELYKACSEFWGGQVMWS